MRPRDELGDFINQKLAEQDRRDLYGLANAGPVRFGASSGNAVGDWSAGVDAGITRRATEIARAKSAVAAVDDGRIVRDFDSDSRDTVPSFTGAVEFDRDQALRRLEETGAKPLYDFGDPLMIGGREGDLLAAVDGTHGKKPAITTEELREKMEDALKVKETQKFLHAIRQAEFNKDSESDKLEADFYQLGYGFKKLDSLEDHPAVLQDSSKQLYSGAYQIGKNTWLAAKSALGLTDFGAHSQDLAAVWLINNRRQLENVMAGDWEKALPVLSREWASLPQNRNGGSYYNQPHMKFETLKGHYDHYKK